MRMQSETSSLNSPTTIALSLQLHRQCTYARYWFMRFRLISTIIITPIIENVCWTSECTAHTNSTQHTLPQPHSKLRHSSSLHRKSVDETPLHSFRTESNISIKKSIKRLRKSIIVLDGLRRSLFSETVNDRSRQCYCPMPIHSDFIVLETHTF